MPPPRLSKKMAQDALARWGSARQTAWKSRLCTHRDACSALIHTYKVLVLWLCNICLCNNNKNNRGKFSTDKNHFSPYHFSPYLPGANDAFIHLFPLCVCVYLSIYNIHVYIIYMHNIHVYIIHTCTHTCMCYTHICIL